MLLVYTDWSCIGNPGPWWWAFLVVSDQSSVISDQFSGWVALTTNNVMELTAAIKALQWLWEQNTKKMWVWNDENMEEGLFGMVHDAPRVVIGNSNGEETVCNDPVVVITDSNYVKLGITEWMVTWKRRQRRRAKGGKLVENVQLWKELDALASCFPNLERQRTKAHVGTELNERVDQLARMEAERRV